MGKKKSGCVWSSSFRQKQIYIKFSVPRGRNGSIQSREKQENDNFVYTYLHRYMENEFSCFSLPKPLRQLLKYYRLFLFGAWSQWQRQIFEKNFKSLSTRRRSDFWGLSSQLSPQKDFSLGFLSSSCFRGFPFLDRRPSRSSARLLPAAAAPWWPPRAHSPPACMHPLVHHSLLAFPVTCGFDSCLFVVLKKGSEDQLTQLN